MRLLMKTNKKLLVYYNDKLVGTLALTIDNRVAFQYCDEWLENGFSISPFSLPLIDKVFIPKDNYNYGLFGVFNDSLPDAFGSLLLDRLLIKYHLEDANVLDRLSIVSKTVHGALSYRPVNDLDENHIEKMDYDEIYNEFSKLFINNCLPEKIEELFNLGGSSGGARPKAYIKIDDEDWIIKFPMKNDEIDSGKKEFEYSLLAKKCGIKMMETKLIPSKCCSGYFATKRFDRKNGQKFHTITLAALLDVNFGMIAFDYNDIFKVTRIITNENKDDIEQLFRIMCFNVFANNEDDHLKNFSFIYDELNSMWRLSPAYDLTHSISKFNEHTTSINGKGKNITIDDLLNVGLKAGINKNLASKIIKSINKEVNDYLKNQL